MASSIINSDDGSVSGTTGLKTTGGDDGELAFESSGTEAMRIDSSGRVGIGTSSPAEALHITTASSSTTAVTGLKIQNSADLNGENVGISFGSTSWPDGGAIYAEDQSNDGLVDICFALRPSGGGNPTERMRIDSSGRVTMPYQPAFDAHYNTPTSGTSGWQKMPVWTATQFNIGGHYSTSTGRFTAPVDGRYFFYAGGWCVTAGDGTRVALELRVNGAARILGGIQLSDGDSPAPIAGYHIQLNAGDYTEIFRYHPITVSYYSNTVYSFRHGGYLIG